MTSTATAVRCDMPKEPADTSQVSVRIPNDWIKELDELAVAMSRPGIDLARADLLRASIARGIKEIKAEMSAAARKKR